MREKTQRFLLLTGFDVNQIAEQMIEMMIGGLRREFEEGFGEQLPEKPERALRRIEEALKERRAEFDNAVIEVIQSNFTEAEMDDLIAFYEGPTGRKLATTLPGIRDKILEAQQTWRDGALKSVEVDLTDLLGDAKAAAAASG